MSGRQEEEASRGAASEPLRLCVLTIVALLTWLIGPPVVAGLAALGFAGYLRARREGLTSSRCILRDTRLVLAYLGVAGLVALAASSARSAACWADRSAAASSVWRAVRRLPALAGPAGQPAASSV